MTATYTFDVFSSLDGYGAASANWTGYWGKQGPELLDHRLALYREEQRMVFGANTYRAFARMLASSTEESEVRDPWVTRMRSLPATVVSTTLEGSLDWPDATVVTGDAVDQTGGHQRPVHRQAAVRAQRHLGLLLEPGDDVDGVTAHDGRVRPVEGSFQRRRHHRRRHVPHPSDPRVAHF